MFDNDKKVFLAKADKSKKGSIDKEIKRLVDLINSKKDYFTTSSCSGRIVLMEKPSEKKFDTKWLFVSHDEVKPEQIKKALKKIPKKPVWFRQEPAIMHICCRTIDSAQKITDVARSIGFKKSGIQSTKKKITVEITSTEYIDTIVADRGKLLVTEEYFKILVDEANKKLKRTREKIKRFISSL